VAYGIRHNVEVFRRIGAPVKRVVAVGGGTKSRAWLQVVSDVTGLVQNVPELTIGASYGDAFLAGLAAGTLEQDDLDQWVKAGEEIAPQSQNQGLYDEMFQRYLALYSQTKDTVHFLSAQG